MWRLLILVALTSVALADPRPELTVLGTAAIEVAAPEPSQGIMWKQETIVPLKGGAFIQTKGSPAKDVTGCVTRKDGSGACKRLRLTVNKPQDKNCTVAIQFPGRTEKKSYQAGFSLAIFDLLELSLEDYGVMSIQLNCEGATAASYGVVNLSTFEAVIQAPAKVSVLADDVQLEDGAKVEEGFWVFATKLSAWEDPVDLLSLCVFAPNGDVECSGGNEVAVRVRHKGLYKFVAWNKALKATVFTVVGV